MSFHDEKHVLTCDVIVLWDGITRPNTEGDKPSYNLKCAIPANAAETAELEQLAQDALNDSEFKGVLPPGANPAMMDVDATKFGPIVVNHKQFSASTTIGCPKVFDVNGNELAAMQYNTMLYPGTKVKLLLHAYTYNNKQRGVKFGLDGVQIVDAHAPKLDVASGLSGAQVAAAFGASPAPQTPPPAQVPAPQAQAATPPPPAPPAAPAEDFAAGKVMTPAANGIAYNDYIAQGWTDEQLIANGLMVG